MTDYRKEWWSLAELDQTTATLSLVDQVFASVLPKTCNYWFNKMVDPICGRVWHMATPKGEPNLRFPKQHSWKNTFHTLEHCFVGYLTAQDLNGLQSELHFAFAERPS